MYVGASSQSNCAGNNTKCSTVRTAGIVTFSLGALLNIIGIAAWASAGSEQSVAAAHYRVVPYADAGPLGGEAGMQLRF